ncbi:anthranilate phosphoribosyltransferase [Clostridium acetireducens DSM 10703]|jgi:anthranilate phosphoribosyltransferase|uniref:Anthranilate phosphoribosyltransferase n=1 Tax=Clostridium acetireducens DSM 10703 TaxID=1121290 RepID=A0A1E8EZE6_9CLOT|nr:anthranilate phosphoribosyltransferase [Clostridium acetireducens]OFI06085.1 anthranilate phosphoribosyltransferase [Clostridium acetireducens DSM 10703]
MSVIQLRESLQQVIQRKDLSFNNAYESTLSLISGEVSNTEIGAFLVALKSKGETVDEIAGMATGIREKAVKINTKQKYVIDTCGTGGDGAGTFNISTTVAFVLAAAGIVVAKHGNGSISSKSGSADVLKALGVNIKNQISDIENQLNTIGIAFIFAPNIHPNMKYVMQARKDLAIPTVFNVLGPLTNPVNLQAQICGVYKKELVLPMAQVLRKLGRKKAVVVHGAGNLDEISLAGDNYIAFLNEDEIQENIINPKDFGINLAANSEIIGGNAYENAQITLNILKGKKGPHRDIVLLNSALGMIIGGKATNIEEGIELAKESIDSGKALEKLQQLIKFTNLNN